MVEIIRNLFRGKRAERAPAIPRGERVYAIGDIHGRLDLFTNLAAEIERDDKRRGPADTTVVFLGDIVDRGPSSARVLASARAWSRARKVRFIAGNHEEMFLLSFQRAEALRNFLKFGGRETILSYGVSPAELETSSLEEIQKKMNEVVPREDRLFMKNFEKFVSIGDYLFVHAGIRPEEPLDKQTGQDCRWIREPFLSYDGSLGQIVVHGHTVNDEVVVRDNRIGIDTGAFMSGKLTALCLEGTERWLIQTKADDGAAEVLDCAA